MITKLNLYTYQMSMIVPRNNDPGIQSLGYNQENNKLSLEKDFVAYGVNGILQNGTHEESKGVVIDLHA